MLNSGNDAPVVHSLIDGGIAEMMLATDNHEDSGDYDDDDNKIVNTGGKTPIENMVKMCGLDRHEFISKQRIVAVYSVEATLLRQKHS